MTAKDYLYYGFGQIIYCLSFSDGKIQEEEKRKLSLIVDGIFNENNDPTIQITQIIFQILDKEHIFTPEDMFAEGVKNMKLGDQYLDKSRLELFRKVLMEIAEAFPPTTPEERKVIQEFNKSFNI